MGRRTGSADLPLHGGRVPPWLASRMQSLGAVIATAIVTEYGRAEFLRRLAHPFWFQSFGAVMGMDWHSSGITTSVLSALKRGLGPQSGELGIYVCGGRGQRSRETPDELLRVGDKTGLDGDALARTSRLVAKVDSAAVQDGFDLYLHGFVVSSEGQWTVVQQGMDTARREARRYHWLSEGLESFVDSPHSAIDGENQGTILNLADARAERARAAQVDLVRLGADRAIREARAVLVAPPKEAPAPQPLLPHLHMPSHHDVREDDFLLRRLHASIQAAAARGPVDFIDLLETKGIGARTLRSLALVAEVMHGAPSRFSDPARFSMAHGGKDGHPFPVPLRVYDKTIAVMRDAVAKAKLGQSDRLFALKRLDLEARRIEHSARGASFAQIRQDELNRSPLYGGRTVMDRER